MRRGPLPSLPGAKVCHAETTSRQQCTGMWHSDPRSPRHFGAAESEVLFLREKPESTWEQISTVGTTFPVDTWQLSIAPGGWNVFLGSGLAQWGATVDGSLTMSWVCSESFQASSCLQSHKNPWGGQYLHFSGQKIKAQRDYMIWHSQPARKWGNQAMNPGLWGPQIHINCWAILSCLEEEIGGGVHHRKFLL